MLKIIGYKTAITMLNEIIDKIGEDNCYNILYGISSSNVFSGFKQTRSNVSTTEIGNIYKEILTEVIESLFNGDISIMTNESKNCFTAGNTVYMILDDEITQGSTLRLEYFIRVRSYEDIKNIEIINKLDDGTHFDKNIQLITASNNSDYNYNYNWNADEYGLIKSNIQSKDGTPKNLQGEALDIKLVVDTVLASGKDLDFGSAFEVNVETTQGTYNNDFETMEVEIIPPFGKNKNYDYIFGVIVLLLMVFVYLINWKRMYKK